MKKTCLIYIFFVFLVPDASAQSGNSAIKTGQVPWLSPTITITTSGGGNITACVSLDTGGYDPVNADYWIAAVYNGTTYYLNSSLVWTETFGPTYQGPLTDFSSIVIYDSNEPFPIGSTVDLYFGVDLSMNGVWDEPYEYTKKSHYFSVDLFSQ